MNATFGKITLKTSVHCLRVNWQIKILCICSDLVSCFTNRWKQHWRLDLFSDVSVFLITLNKVIGRNGLTARSYCHCVTGQSTFHTQTTTTHCKKWYLKVEFLDFRIFYHILDYIIKPSANKTWSFAFKNKKKINLFQVKLNPMWIIFLFQMQKIQISLTDYSTYKFENFSDRLLVAVHEKPDPPLF